MIALSIAITWLTLTAAGFHVLSALDRSELRDDFQAALDADRHDLGLASADALIDLRSATPSTMPAR
jgi:hypothetical protein